MISSLLSLWDRVSALIRYDAEKEFYQRHFPSLVNQAVCRIRPMARKDLLEVHAIEKQAYAFPWDLETLRSCHRVGYHCWVAECAGTLVGYGILTIGAGESHVLNLCIAPGQQGKGYGRKMLEQMVAEARRAQVECVFLEVRPSNPQAIALYQRMGFNEIGRRKAYYPAKNGREDALVMALAL